ncbi:MAG: methionyl-tRNA formyltransferase [Cyanobacteria bacterium P01_H01_bin.119]
MRIAFFGTPQFATPSLQALLGHPEIEVAAVVTQPDKRRGRGKRVSPSPVKAVAMEANCPVLQPKRIKRDEAALKQLRDIGADAFVVVAYGQILSPEILEMPRLGCINAHGSLLPAYRGAAPIQWCLYHGEAETGITTMLMDPGMDTGAMLLKSVLPIRPADHALDLAKSLSALSADLLIKTLQNLEQGTITPEPQNNAIATYAPLIQKEDYALDWQRSAIALHNQIRGFYPNCTAQFRGEPLKITVTVPLEAIAAANAPPAWQNLIEPAQALSSDSPVGAPGEIMAFLKQHGPIVQTGNGLLLLSQVKPSGKSAQSGRDFVNGSRLSVGERFE